MLGKIKWFNAEKGFGFITPNEGNSDIFVHFTGLSSGVTIKEDDAVEFEVKDGKRGNNAVNVKKR